VRKEVSFAGGKAEVVHMVTYTLQEKEILQAVAREKVRSLEDRLNWRRFKPGRLAHTRTAQELEIWKSIAKKFDPDQQ
jgi:hypothetical protein